MLVKVGKLIGPCAVKPGPDQDLLDQMGIWTEKGCVGLRRYPAEIKMTSAEGCNVSAYVVHAHGRASIVGVLLPGFIF